MLAVVLGRGGVGTLACMGWRTLVSGAMALSVAALAGCAGGEGVATADLCVVTPAEVAEALEVDVADVTLGAAGGAAPVSATNFRCTYAQAGSSDRVVDFSGWPGGVAIGNEMEDPDGTRNPEPANVAGSPTAYFTNSGWAIRFSDGEMAYTIWMHDGDRPDGAALEGLAELALQRLASAS